MKRTLYTGAAFIVGLIFGAGLIVSGMFNPAKVLGFLDLAGPWDPSLALVMAGAVAVGMVGFGAAAKRAQSWLGAPMQLPKARDVDASLLLGSLAFGVGWGLAGFCPGPALVALGAGQAKAVVFVAAMIVGMLVFEILERLQRTNRSDLPSNANLARKADG
ncbi:MAG TPA: YeeE/YedE family protein [Casimicrobiaceae bacterium]|nr:YeeE/YedE family protein [Casimicrobiaceae bacterium]